MNKTELRLSKLNGTQEEDYAVEVEKRIRKRYSVSAELAILRQRNVKPEEFEEYNAFVEACKSESKLSDAF